MSQFIRCIIFWPRLIHDCTSIIKIYTSVISCECFKQTKGWKKWKYLVLNMIGKLHECNLRSSVTSKFFHGSFQYLLFIYWYMYFKKECHIFFTQCFFKLYLSSDGIDRNLLVQYPVEIQGTCIHWTFTLSDPRGIGSELIREASMLKHV